MFLHVPRRLQKRKIRTEDMAEMVECLPTKNRALNSNPEPPQKEKENKDPKKPLSPKAYIIYPFTQRRINCNKTKS
jgi:hypothetical protein